MAQVNLMVPSFGQLGKRSQIKLPVIRLIVNYSGFLRTSSFDDDECSNSMLSQREAEKKERMKSVDLCRNWKNLM